MTELSPEAQALIRAADRGGPSPERRARLERRLAAAALAATAGGAVSTISTTASAKAVLGTAAGKSLASGLGASIASCLAAGFVVGGITVASVHSFTDTTGDAANARPSAAAVSPRREARSDAKANASSKAAVHGEPSTPHAEAVELELAPAGKKPGHRPQLEQPAGAEHVASATDSPRVDDLPDIGAEASLIAAARRELAAGKPEQALERLAEHESGFASGMLSEERRALRVVALCNLGRRDEARQIADAFLREAPRSPLVPRIRKSCAFAGAPEGAGDR